MEIITNKKKDNDRTLDEKENQSMYLAYYSMKKKP